MKNKKIFFVTAALFLTAHLLAQNTGAFDIFSYKAPEGFVQKEVNSNRLFFEKVEGESYCQLYLWSAIAGSGNAEKNFEKDWNDFATAPYNVTKPDTKEKDTANGWAIVFGGARGVFNNIQFVISISTFTNEEFTFSIVSVLNDQKFLQAAQNFTTSVVPDTKKFVKQSNQPGNAPAVSGNSNQPVAAGFQFTRTNFDDGWVSIPREDWVETTKGAVKLLIHYPSKTADEYNPDGDAALKKAWNLLVAPRYSNATNMFFKSGYTFESTPNYGAAEMTEQATGKRVYVVFYQRTNLGSNNKYVEIIAPSKAVFEQQFGNYETNKANRTWDALNNLQNYNKFAVAPSDLKGTWTTDFGAAISYVYVATGLDAGTNTYSSAESFQFFPGSKYEWKLSTASGMVGNIKFQGAASQGTVTMPDNWHIQFSDISGKPKLYEAGFSCIRGLRILWLDGHAFAKKN